MRITRLEIFGFKSFVDRFVLTFDKDMIGVVGPNGCGKSNIVDALRWVLGETHARQLRGNLQEDLIFNGSDSRRPLGMAEVSITIQPTEGWQPATFTPLLELADAAALLAKNESNSSENAESTPEAEQTPEPEEAEGSQSAVSGELAQLAELDRETGMPPALSAIPGLLNASEIQLTRRLYRSGESEYFINRVPCRLRDMTDLYRLIGLGSRGLSIVQQGQISEIIGKKPLERRELLEEAAGISGFRARMEAAERELGRTSENMARLGDIITEVDKQVRVLERQAKRARQRGELKAALKERDQKLFYARGLTILGRKNAAAAERESIQEQIARAKADLSVAAAEEQAEHAVLEELETRLADLRGRRDQVSSQLNEQREREQELRIEVARLDSRERSVEGGIQNAEKREDEITVELNSLSGEVDAARRALEAIDSERGAAEANLAGVQAQTKQLIERGAPADDPTALEVEQLTAELEKLPALSSRIAEAEESIRALRREFQSAGDRLQNQRVRKAAVESELASLDAQLEALKEHVREAAPISADAEAYRGAQALLGAITVPEAYQRAVAAVIGEKANYLITSDPLGFGAAFAAGPARAGKKIGVIDLYPRSDAAPGALSPAELEAAPSAKRLLDLVRVADGFADAVSALLGRVVYTEELGEAFSLYRLAKNRGTVPPTVVTREGEVVTEWGWFTTDGTGASLAFTRKISEKTELARQVAEECGRLEEQYSLAAAKLAASEDALTAEKLEREELLRRQRRLAELNRELQLHERARRDSALGHEREAQAEVRRVLNELSSATNKVRLLEQQVEGLKRESAQVSERRVRLISELETLRSERADLERELQSSAAYGASPEVQRLAREFEELGGELRSVDGKRVEVRARLGRITQTTSERKRAIDSLLEKDNSIMLAVERAQLELSLLQEEYKRLYDEDLCPGEAEASDPEKIPTAEVLAGLEEDAAKLRRRLEREGEVDPASIEQFETESLRLADLRKQFSDLQQASQILERTLRQLKEISKIRFVSTFKDVQQRFGDLIPRLFGGGAGSLELINPEDPLSSGIELMIRPPGKKIRTLDLLSGGEKALAAAALLVAMFLHRPSPICVLDEVDAPLDDANLDRFLALISEIARQTQFLVITHNKQSMAAVGRLVGITMQESGVSTALSVSLEEAEADLERWASNA